jgi:hypothetical protein
LDKRGAKLHAFQSLSLRLPPIQIYPAVWELSMKQDLGDRPAADMREHLIFSIQAAIKYDGARKRSAAVHLFEAASLDTAFYRNKSNDKKREPL